MTSFYYECTNCKAHYTTENVIYLCPQCSEKQEENEALKGVLKVVYQYETCEKDFKALQNTNFIELLPLNSYRSFPKLNIGHSPLYCLDIEHNDKKIIFYAKDDSRNPTFSYKDRASALVSAFALEHNLNTIVAASTGNAGSSIAGICAFMKQRAIVFVPEKAPLAKLTQILMYGAQLVPVVGNYDKAVEMSRKATQKFGWYNRNTAFNPITIEGKKTAAFEIYEQFDFQLPDRIFVPVGDGVIIAGIYKGFEDLLRLSIISKVPEIVAVQAAGSSNLVKNLNNETPCFENAHTVADSISVEVPAAFYLCKEFITNYKGKTVIVSDEEIISASAILAKTNGLFTEPASAAAFAGFLKWIDNDIESAKQKNLIMLTGSGLKDLKSVQNILNMPKAISDISEIESVV